MNEKFFLELARRLRHEGITTGPAEKDRLPVLLNGQEVIQIESQNCIVIVASFADDPEADRLYETVRDLSSTVYEYTEAVASAPVLKAVGLYEEYRLLAEYNDVVLAGQELEGNLGYQFVTWRRNYDRTAVVHGNYYYNDYDGAKLDFDDLPLAQYIDPPLTTVHVPAHYMGQVAVWRLIERCEEKNCLPVKIEISTSLKNRKSI